MSPVTPGAIEKLSREEDREKGHILFERTGVVTVPQHGLSAGREKPVYGGQSEI